MRFHRLIAATAAVALTSTAAAALGATPAGAAIAERWRREASGAWFQWSSPVIADVNRDGSNDVVVGGLDGKVYAYDANGGDLPGWPEPALGPVASSPAVGDLDADGRSEVVVGTGSLELNARRGGLTILNADGTHRCNVLTDTRHGSNADRTAVFNAPAIGDVDGDGDNDVVFGAWDHWIYAVRGDCSVLGRFENTDTVWSAPALYDIDGIAGMEIFIGGDATRDEKGLPHSGGYFRSLTWNGSSLVQRWVQHSDETFQSAAAIGDVNNDGRLEVVTGTGVDYCRWHDAGRCGASRNVWAWDLDNGSPVPGWPKQAAFSTFLAAPALGDVNADGLTDVVVGSTEYEHMGNAKRGAYDAFLGGGKGSWRFTRDGDEAVASPVIADVIAGGSAEVIVGIAAQVFVLNGTNGSVLQDRLGGTPNRALAHKTAAAVGELGAGRWAMVTAGVHYPSYDGYVQAYDVAAPASSSWPQYRKNAARLGADPSPLGRPRTNAPNPPATPVTQPPPPVTTTTKPKATPTTKRTAPPTTATTAPPPPPETTTTSPPETTTTLPPETTTTTLEDTTERVELAGRQSGGGGSGSGPLLAFAGLLGISGGGLFFGWRRRQRG